MLEALGELQSEPTPRSPYSDGCVGSYGSCPVGLAGLYSPLCRLQPGTQDHSATQVWPISPVQGEGGQAKGD